VSKEDTILKKLGGIDTHMLALIKISTENNVKIKTLTTDHKEIKTRVTNIETRQQEKQDQLLANIVKWVTVVSAAITIGWIGKAAALGF